MMLTSDLFFCRLAIIQQPTNTCQKLQEHIKAIGQLEASLCANELQHLPADSASIYEWLGEAIKTRLRLISSRVQHLYETEALGHDGSPLVVIQAIKAAEAKMSVEFVTSSFLSTEVKRCLVPLGSSALSASGAGLLSNRAALAATQCLQHWQKVAQMDVMDTAVQGGAVELVADEFAPHVKLMEAAQQLQDVLLEEGRSGLRKPLEELTLRVSLLQRELLKAAIVALKAEFTKKTHQYQASRSALLESGSVSLWRQPAGADDPNYEPAFDVLTLNDMRHLTFALRIMQETTPSAVIREQLSASSPQVTKTQLFVFRSQFS